MVASGRRLSVNLGQVWGGSRSRSNLDHRSYTKSIKIWCARRRQDAYKGGGIRPMTLLTPGIRQMANTA
eukprot:1133799-Prorocentrum_lima.AAC.1